MNIYPAYISKQNLNHGNQIILLMSPKWRKIALSCNKKVPALLREILSNCDGDFYSLNKRLLFFLFFYSFLNCLRSFRIKNKLEFHKKDVKNKDFCGSVMSFKDTKILEFSQYRKPDKVPSIAYADLEIFD